MKTIPLQQARSSLSRLIQAIEQGTERAIITRNDRPVAKRVPPDTITTGQRIGVAKGRFELPDSIDTDNEMLARLFQEKQQS